VLAAFSLDSHSELDASREQEDLLHGNALVVEDESHAPRRTPAEVTLERTPIILPAAGSLKEKFES
jgi:hypothetical protein